ncbi:conserved hypothetical protein [Gammaproteobacteria bacterium]
MPREIFQDLRDECECQNARYCPLEVLLEYQSERTLEQHKCVELYKYNRGREENQDIGWQRAYTEWTSKGYAEAFAEVYKAGMKHREIYSEIIKRMEKRDDGKKG